MALKNHNMSKIQLVGLSTLAGIMYWCAHVAIGQWWMAWLCLAPILIALDDKQISKKEAIGIAWWFGFISYLSGYHWMTEVLQTFGSFSHTLAIAAWIFMSLFMGMLLGAWGVATFALKRFTGIPIWMIAGPMFMLIEWIWPAVFPVYFSNSQYRYPLLIQSLDFMGPLGLSGLITFSNAVLFEIISWKAKGDRPFPRRGITVFALLFISNLAYGFYAIRATDGRVQATERSVKVGIVQANVSVSERRREPDSALNKHWDQTQKIQQQGVDVVIWPENGYPFPVSATHTSIPIQTNVRLKQPLLLGALKIEPGSPSRERYNTAFLIDPEGRILDTYDKNILLPFGEYFPFADRFPWLKKLSPKTGNLTHGAHPDPLQLNDIEYGVLICYEDILPGFVRKAMSSQPDVLVNISNDGWFGDTQEAIYHLALSTFRAVEQRRYLIRSANTGISAIVDPVGRILDPTPTFEPSLIVGEVKPMEGLTLYQRFGNWPGPASLLFILILIYKARKNSACPPP